MFIPLELAVVQSRICAGVFTLVHGMSLAGVWLAALPVWIQSGLTLPLILSAAYQWIRRQERVRALRVTQSGILEIKRVGWHPAMIKGHPVVLPWMVSLVLADEVGKPQRLIIWPDSADAQGQRRLRVWLKWGFKSDVVG